MTSKLSQFGSARESAHGSGMGVLVGGVLRMYDKDDLFYTPLFDYLRAETLMIRGGGWGGEGGTLVSYGARSHC